MIYNQNLFYVVSYILGNQQFYSHLKSNESMPAIKRKLQSDVFIKNENVFLLLLTNDMNQIFTLRTNQQIIFLKKAK